MRVSNRTWATILAAVVGIAVVFAGVSAVRADPTPELPAIPPAQLLASALVSLGGPVAISGEVTTHVDLGLPELPAGLGGGSLGPVTSVAGDQRFKVWRSPAGARVAHLLAFDEQDAIANATDAWFWDSRTMTATHVRTPLVPEPARRVSPIEVPSPGDVPGLARRLLAALQPYADVSVDGTGRVAGRPVYEVTLTPRSTVSRIGRIVVALDSQSRLPLRLQVFPRGEAGPAIEAGFTSVRFGPIPASTFSFTPPPGAVVKTPDSVSTSGGGDLRTLTGLPAIDQIRTFGTGFDLRWALRLSAPLPAAAGAVLPYAGPLLSAEVVDQGGATWLLAGFVDLQTLRDDANRLP